MTSPPKSGRRWGLGLFVILLLAGLGFGLRHIVLHYADLDKIVFTARANDGEPDPEKPAKKVVAKTDLKAPAEKKAAEVATPKTVAKNDEPKAPVEPIEKKQPVEKPVVPDPEPAPEKIPEKVKPIVPAEPAPVIAAPPVPGGNPVAEVGPAGLEFNGRVAANDNRVRIEVFASDLPAKRFPIRVVAGKRYRITMDSREIDSVLVIRNSAGNTVAWDDDSGGALNSLVTFAAPRDDVYTIHAGSLDGREGGFTVRVREEGVPAFQNPIAPPRIIGGGLGGPREIQVGETVVDEMVNGNEKYYFIRLDAGRNYVIDMVSANTGALDPYLYLEDPNGRRIALNDDGGNGLNSRIIHRNDAPGLYKVIASSFGTRGRGAYNLRVRSYLGFQPPEPPNGFVNAGEIFNPGGAIERWNGPPLPKLTEAGLQSLDELLRACVLSRGIKAQFDAKIGDTRLTLADEKAVKEALVANARLMNPATRDALVCRLAIAEPETRLTLANLLKSISDETDDDAAAGYAYYFLARDDERHNRFGEARERYDIATMLFTNARLNDWADACRAGAKLAAANIK